MKNFNIILSDRGVDSIWFAVVTVVALKCIYKMVKETMSYRKHHNECLIKASELAVTLKKMTTESDCKNEEEP